MLPTAAGISSFFEHEIAMIQLEGKIFDRLGTVIMDFFRGSTTMGTDLLCGFGFEINFNKRVRMNNFFTITPSKFSN